MTPHPTDELNLSESGPSQPAHSPEEQPVESEIFYFGGPLFGIDNPGLSCNSEVLKNEDGTQVAFCVDPRSPATRRSAMSVRRQSKVLFTEADIKRILGDTRNNSDPLESIFGDSEDTSDFAAELNDDVVDDVVELNSPTSSTMANIEDNSKLLLLADVALGNTTLEGYSPQEGQQPAQATTRDNSAQNNAQAAQVPPNGGLIAINSATATASTRPSQGRTPRRTTGFNRRTGEGMLTNVCGIVTPQKAAPVASKSKQRGHFRCPRCGGRFTRPRSVKDHFIKCVGKYGNPAGLSWWDHPSLDNTKIWHHEHDPTVKEEEEGDEEEGNEEEGDTMEEDGGQSAQAGESGDAAGEARQDGEVQIEEQDQGRGPSNSTRSTPFSTPYQGYPIPPPSGVSLSQASSGGYGNGGNSLGTRVPRQTRYHPYHPYQRE